MLSLNERRKYIKTYVNSFFPNDMANLISEYDYHFNGDSYVALTHCGRIECLSIFPDGRILCAIRSKLKVFYLHMLGIIDSDNFINGTVLQEHQDKIITMDSYSKIWCRAMLPDKRVVIGLSDAKLKILDLETNKCVLTLTGHASKIYCVLVLQDCRIISGSADHTLKIWNLHTGNCEITLKGHTSAVLCCSTLPDGKIISGSGDKTLKIWNLLTNECLLTLKDHKRSIFCIGIISDHTGYRIVSGSTDSTIKIWNSSAFKTENNIINSCELTLTGHSDTVYCINILPDGRIISGSCDNTIKIWNVQNQSLKNKCEMTLCGHSDTVSCINILPDGRVVSGSKDGTIIIWT